MENKPTIQDLRCNNYTENELRLWINEFDILDWKSISVYQKLSEKFIREFQDKVDWFTISYKQKLSENLIRDFQYDVDWFYICSYQKLSEGFIREFKNRVNWTLISIYQKLSESFIEEFSHKVHWERISSKQNLSEEFILKHLNELSLQDIVCHQRLSEEFLDNHKEFRIWESLLFNNKANLSNLIKKYIDEIVISIKKDENIYHQIENNENIDDETCSFIYEVLQKKSNNLKDFIK